MQKKMTKRRKALRRELKGLAFVAPAFIGLLVFTLYPMVNAVINSLYNWNMGGRSAKKFVGLYNYRKLFRNDEIYLILSNTLRYVLYILPFILVFGFLLGVLLLAFIMVNRGVSTDIPTPDQLSASKSAAEKEAFIDEISRRRKRARPLLYMIFPLVFIVGFDMVYTLLFT